MTTSVQVRETITSVKVREFHETFGHPVRALPKLDVPHKALRLALIQEEHSELSDAVADQDFVEIVDALGDIDYVAHGAALTFGIQLDTIIRRVEHLDQRPLDEEMYFLAKGFEENNIDEVAISLANISVIVHKMADTLGVDLDRIIEIIHASNMSKLGEDGKPIYNEVGKVQKGPNYFPPTVKIEQFLIDNVATFVPRQEICV